jgi:UDP-2-acetamido-3-amino-2,3-dideoxy-glucuronate N-acetyltransferase
VTAGTDRQQAQVEATADVHASVLLGAGTRVWHLAQIREGARLGSDCIVGRGAYVGPGVIIGDKVKLQNYALVYEPARLEDGVFVGPAAVLTNDVYPRSVDVEGRLKRPADWAACGVTVREGASLGACSVIVAGCQVGRWAMVAAGAVGHATCPTSRWWSACPRGASDGSATPGCG